MKGHHSQEAPRSAGSTDTVEQWPPGVGAWGVRVGRGRRFGWEGDKVLEADVVVATQNVHVPPATPLHA